MRRWGSDRPTLRPWPSLLLPALKPDPVPGGWFSAISRPDRLQGAVSMARRCPGHTEVVAWEVLGQAGHTPQVPGWGPDPGGWGLREAGPTSPVSTQPAGKEEGFR